MSGINSVKNYKYSILVKKKNKGIKKTKEKTKKSVLEAPFMHTTKQIHHPNLHFVLRYLEDQHL